MGLKDLREIHFQKWENYILDDNWRNCDKETLILLHTISEDAKQRKELEAWITDETHRYIKQKQELEQQVTKEINPFKREEIKDQIGNIDLEHALNIHNKFFTLFIREGLLEKDK